MVPWISQISTKWLQLCHQGLLQFQDFWLQHLLDLRHLHGGAVGSFGEFLLCMSDLGKIGDVGNIMITSWYIYLQKTWGTNYGNYGK